MYSSCHILPGWVGNGSRGSSVTLHPRGILRGLLRARGRGLPAGG